MDKNYLNIIKNVFFYNKYQNFIQFNNKINKICTNIKADDIHLCRIF